MSRNNQLPISSPSYVRIADLIGHDIINNAFKPGERLKVLDLAKRYSSSQMPIREALQMLQGSGLVDISPNRGAVVREIDEQYIADHYDMRAALEMWLAVQALTRLDSVQIANLRRLARKFEDTVKSGKTSSCFAADHQFHQTINHLSGNLLATKFLARQSKLLQAQRLRSGYGPGRLDKVIEEHVAIVDALEAHDSDLVAKLILAHLIGAKEDIIAQMVTDYPVAPLEA